MLEFLLLFIPATFSISCYNGMKMLRMQSVGQSVEECPSGSYCYNMTASAALVVDVVKAGCSTWRCMLARDKCISMTFQMIPVSLCCCSYDRCNVAENPVYDQLPSSGSDSGWGGSGGSGGSGNENGFGTNTNENNNYNGWGNNNDGHGTSPTHLSPKQIEDHFKNFDVDHHGDGDGGEEVFDRVDVRYTTPSSRGRRLHGSPTSRSQGREIELDD